MQENKPVLIVGLGNPGAEYKGTRHNVGFMAVDFLAGADAVWKKEKNALVTKTTPALRATPPSEGNHKTIIFAKPQTFMNLSGSAVRDLMNFYKIPLENLIVIHDDIDLKLGVLREKVGGGSAGHNGIKSIDASVGNEYRRIRIGVGRPENENIETSDWVLGKFAPNEISKIKIESIKI